jgi:hypothetical protein
MYGQQKSGFTNPLIEVFYDHVIKQVNPPALLRTFTYYS